MPLDLDGMREYMLTDEFKKQLEAAKETGSTWPLLRYELIERFRLPPYAPPKKTFWQRLWRGRK